jgi:anaerobic selenocysteine-containing dehydrogenase
MIQKPTVCQICGCNCSLLATIENDRIVSVEGNPQAPHNRGGICVKGKMSPNILYAPDRIASPLKRRKDGSGFSPITWGDALSEIAEKILKIKNDHGAEALTIYRGRSTRFIDRAFIAAFAQLYGTPNVTGVWTLCVGPKIIGYRATFGLSAFPMCDFQNAGLIVLWGTNPAASRMHRYFKLPQDIRAAIKKGAELVIVDPRKHRFAKEADLHLPITPGTDTYLIMALIKLITDRGWIDNEYIRKYTTGFDRLVRSLEGFDLNTAAASTGIPFETIEALAKKIANIKPAAIDRREGVIHQTNGTQINRALAILIAITGNADIPGGLNFTAWPKWDSTLGISKTLDVQAIWDSQYPLALDGAQTLTDAILEEEPYPIKAMISISGNPMSSLPNTKRVGEALGKLDLLVVNDLFMTETAAIADYVLPGATFYEKGEFHTEPLKPEQWIQATEPLVEPQGESKPEWRFIKSLAEHMGIQELSEFENEDTILNKVFHDSGHPELDPTALRQGLNLGPMTFGKLLDSGFSTPSGKIEIYSDWFEQSGYAPLPVAEDACFCTDAYPYRLITGARSDAFYHSQYRNIPELRKLCPHPEAEIPTEIASLLNVENGDLIVVKTEWGKMNIRLKIVDGMNPNTISIPHGWPGRDNANYLVGDKLRDNIAGTPAYKAVPCNVIKAE